MTGRSLTLRRALATTVVGLLVVIATGGPLDTPAQAQSQSTSRCLQEVEGLFPHGPAGGSDAVLMIHGWTGSPEGWTEPIDVSVNSHNRPPGRTLVDQVKRFGDTDVWLLDYEVYSRRWVTDVNVGGRVGAAIDCLADTYQRPIGVMAHSMGGLAMRQALAEDASRTDRVAGLVTFGTPHLGSDVAAALAYALGLADSSVARPPRLQRLHIELLRACGLLSDLVARACWPLPAQIASFDSSAGIGLRTGSDQLRALPPFPPELAVASLAGDLEIVNQVSTGLFYQDLGRLRVGDAVVTRPSATADGTDVRSWNCRYNLRTAPAAANIARDAFGVSVDDGTERNVVRAPNSACLHWKLMRAQEPTNYAIGFMHERLNDGVEGSSGRIDAAVDAATRATRAGVSPVQLIIDVSGSMNERDSSGTVRLDGAKTALADMLFELPTDTPVGVRYYPDAGVECDPGRALVPVGPLDAGRSTAVIDTLAADGNTPTGPALQAAVDELRAQGYQSGQLVLVSDGESNCGDPPCEVAQGIVADGFEVSVNALGFETTPAGREELSCISNATGGTYVDVDDSDELTEQLVALSGAQLDLTVDQPDITPSGVQVPVEVTIANNSAIDAADVQVTLGFDQAGAQTVIPAVLPPRFRVGNIPAGEQVTRRWDVTAGSAGDGGVARSRVTAWGQDTPAVSATGDITITPGLPSVTDAGEVLRDVRANGGRVAVIGDSFSSGEGAGRPYLPGTDELDNRCHRSHRTHASALYGSDTVDLIACSGAVIQNLYTSQSGRAGTIGQLRRLEQLDRRPDLVVMTLGGNDIGFADIIKRCVKPGDCSTDYPFVVATLQRIEGLQPDLRRAYREISWTVEHSPVVVLGYPVALPYAGSATCTGFNANEIVFGNHVVRELNGAIERAVAAVRDEGFDVRFVPQTAQAMLPSNTACHDIPHLVSVDLVLGLANGAVDWTTGQYADLAQDRWWLVAPGDGTSFAQELMHPNEWGYRSMAHALVRWSTTYEEPDEPLVPPPDTRPPRLEVRDTTRSIDLRVEDSVDVRQGDRIELQAGGFASGSTVTLQVRSHPIALATAIADDDGEVTADVTVPAELPLGTHRLEAFGHDPDVQTLVVGRVTDVRAVRPGYVPLLWAGSGLALVIALLALGTVRRDQRRSRRR